MGEKIIEEKLDKLNKQIKEKRLKEAKKSNKKWAIESTGIILLVMVAIAFGVTLNPSVHVTNIPDTYYIDGWSIHMLGDENPKMQDRVGFTNGSEEIYLQTGRTPVETYRTCVHEIKHNEKPSMDHPEHDWWYEEEEQTYNEVCIQLMAKLQVDKTYFEEYGQWVEEVY